MHDADILFSIIVPVYNVENWLSECLESLVGQAIELSQKVEILLIDDGSADKSPEICDAYEEKYPKLVHCFHKKNEGLLLTRRFGIKKARGTYIVNCDSDDVMEKDALALLEETIEKYREPDVIFFNYAYYENGNKTPRYENLFSAARSVEVERRDVLEKYFVYNTIVSMCGKVCKRNCYEPDKDYRAYAWIGNGEDSLQTLEIFDHAKTFVYLNKTLYNYRVGSGMTAKYDPKFLESFMAVTEEIEKKRSSWDLENFDKLLTEKTLSSIGRAITQSRLASWENSHEYAAYIRSIYENNIVRRYINSSGDKKISLKKEYSVLLKLLRRKKFKTIVYLLKIRNIL